MVKYKAAPHKERLTPEAQTCLHLFHHTSQKSSQIQPVFAAVFVSSDEKSDCAIPRFPLRGVAIILLLKDAEGSKKVAGLRKKALKNFCRL
ncbi:MAG: hypothetical protein VB060_13105 [Oscillibacter sp.]|uniref:hypothetical protein n=1 Tax=Oscillibacter sp. TaxID=1945593 RepID=UPI00289AB4E6|nr:hypothetical protein [Oscillibacter sp.]MEA4994735.1 hypothetical protein [Oscillibacter sp.]